MRAKKTGKMPSGSRKPMTKAQERKLLKRAVNKAFSLWGEIGSLKSDFACELCGAKRGDIKDNGKPVVLNHHHLIGREWHNLRFNPHNCITLDQWCHKFSRTGAHRGSFIFNEWFRTNEYRSDDYHYLLSHKDDEVVESLEDVLLAASQLNFEKLSVLKWKLQNT